ncbi:hypothetical protein MJ561_05965 [Klebsiella pneumoniae]|nr:hypothetical protein MJ561_05965 [Klebsiella pneumoniae]
MIRQHQLPQRMLSAFDVPPEMKMTPHHVPQRQIKGRWKLLNWRTWWGGFRLNMILPSRRGFR